MRWSEYIVNRVVRGDIWDLKGNKPCEHLDKDHSSRQNSQDTDLSWEHECHVQGIARCVAGADSARMVVVGDVCEVTD